MLGTTLELASGQLLDDYLQARFLEPMGLRASLHAGRLEAEEVACLYNAAGGVERGPGAQTGQQVPQEIGLGASYFPGGLTISAADLAKLVALLADDGLYEGRRYLEAASVAAMEQEAFVVEPENAASFSQCLALRRQEDLMGGEALYYHTGSSYGVHALLSYDPNAGDGVVVLTTGTESGMSGGCIPCVPGCPSCCTREWRRERHENETNGGAGSGAVPAAGRLYRARKAG